MKNRKNKWEEERVEIIQTNERQRERISKYESNANLMQSED